MRPDAASRLARGKTGPQAPHSRNRQIGCNIHEFGCRRTCAGRRVGQCPGSDSEGQQGDCKKHRNQRQSDRQHANSLGCPVPYTSRRSVTLSRNIWTHSVRPHSSLLGIRISAVCRRRRTVNCPRTGGAQSRRSADQISIFDADKTYVSSQVWGVRSGFGLASMNTSRPSLVSRYRPRVIAQLQFVKRLPAASSILRIPAAAAARNDSAPAIGAVFAVML